jgi:glutathione peroxidase
MRRLFALTLFALGVCLMTSTSSAEDNNDAKKGGEAISFTMKSLDGKDVDLKSYAGKVVLVVNTASKCGLTYQYKDLQELHEKYKDKGLAVLGFPCNQFLGQEPGDEKQISEFCTKNYGVTFDMFAKVEVNKDGACALYKYLTDKEAPPVGKGPVSWNFEKFLINRKGELVNRFGPRTEPDAKEVIAAIEKELAAK